MPTLFSYFFKLSEDYNLCKVAFFFFILQFWQKFPLEITSSSYKQRRNLCSGTETQPTQSGEPGARGGPSIGSTPSAAHSPAGAGSRAAQQPQPSTGCARPRGHPGCSARSKGDRLREAAEGSLQDTTHLQRGSEVHPGDRHTYITAQASGEK